MWLGVAHAETFRPLPALAALAATVATAAASYHLVEQPIRRGRLGAWLSPRRLVVAVAVVMAVVLGWSSALRATHGIGPATRVIIATGDSVPMKMMTPLDRAATARGWAIDSAARGGCTPLAIEMQQYLKPPHEGAGDCRGVRPIQDALIDRYDPEIVFWWSRYEWHQRWLDGRVVGPWEEAFWVALEADVAQTVDRLTRDGAILVIGRTERPGPGLFDKCAPGATDCYPLDDVALNHDEYRRRWNDMVLELVATDPRVRSFDLDPLICNDEEPAEAVSPAACDDRQPDGGLLRPDGVHIRVDPYGRPTADRIIDAVLEAAEG